MSSFPLQMGWDWLIQTMEEGWAGENSIPRGAGRGLDTGRKQLS